MLIVKLLLGLAALSASFLAPSNAQGAEQVVTLGDSLTFSYEAAFCFRVTTPLGSFGDNMTERVRNWAEILGNPTYRGALFDLGARDSVNVSFGGAPIPMYFRQAHNWAIPGLKAEGMKKFVLGESTFTGLVAGDPDFGSFATLLSFSDFNEATDFSLTDFQNQIQNVAEKVVISIGGNDARQIYGTVYNGGAAGTFTTDFLANINAVITRVQTLKPGIPIVLVNVPHVGITPRVRADFPYDVTKTGRVTTLLNSLNSQLATLAKTKGIGYADIYSLTLPLINPAVDFCHGGYVTENKSTGNGLLTSLWLNGTLSNNFHPNTGGQVAFANEIIDAFNRRYDSGIASLSTAEVGTILNRGDLTRHITFSKWMANYRLTGLSASDDSDGDGIPASVEFAAGLNPTRNDSWKIKHRKVGNQIELAFPVRYETSAHFNLSVQSSSNLNSFGTVTAGSLGADGLKRAVFSGSGGKAFLRLKATIP